ncbi:hypothetical protein K439DRAFT_1533176 [Ramaria rubella]|nr:hypothetical protein K439DRAFT_1533176 [Ramaria rubella]
MWTEQPQHLIKAAVASGYLGSSPIHPKTVFSFQLMRYFKTLSTRCLQPSAQSFVKYICEIQSVLYWLSLHNKFSDAYDIYVTICTEVQHQVSTMLGQDAPDWHLKNACLACTYKLDGEPLLKISMQVTMDDNNTQKHVHSDYYLSPQEHNKIHRLATTGMEGHPVDSADEPTPCIEKWTNLSQEAIKRMWGIYLETGIFLALCRHGTVLIMCNMLCSGELAKYPLVIMNKLVDIFGHDLMCGYDIGCNFSITANNSPLRGGKLQEKQTRFCCGSFHGHAHCHLCQLDWHPLYIEGSGLEEYEGCECAFSDSNGTGRWTRYATRFHKKQILVLHFERWDNDRYQELSLKTEPELDVLNIEHLSTLIKLRQADQQWELVPVEELRLDNYYHHAEKHTRHLETGHSQALELLLTLRKALFDLEHKLGIYETWMPACQGWQETEKYMNMHTYQRALDTLESLVVARLCELTKLNQSGIGYKLCAHIEKAMKAHSQAIRTAIKHYNDAAMALQPARATLDPKDVLDYVFLAEFDLLRDACNNIRNQPWVQAPECLASVTYFKIRCSHEEKARVEVEACRLRTSIHDESQHFMNILDTLRVTDPLLAHQLTKVVLW